MFKFWNSKHYLCLYYSNRDKNMLQVKKIRENYGVVKAGLDKRGWSNEAIRVLDDVLSIDDERKKMQTLQDAELSKLNALSATIGSLFKQGKQQEAEEAKAEVNSIKEVSAKFEAGLKNAEIELYNLLVTIPNIPHTSVPAGTSEKDNEVYQDWGNPLPEIDGLPHWDLGTQYNILNFELGVKVTGAGFPVFRGKGSRLQRGLINFFLDEATKAGYEEIVPPLLVNEDTAHATGQLPDKEGQMYFCEKDNLYLIPTAEVPVTNILRGDTYNVDQLPIKLTGYTPCFRREAGSYGSDVKGLNRVHQFDKVEIIQVAHPDKSYDTLMEMCSHVESLLLKLELPYRILRLCGGDMGFTSALTFDFEVYAAAQKRWLEVSSVSNFETFQSNRLKLNFKDQDGKRHLAHTLNGSALALARIIAALLENNQTPEGIVIPQALRPYTGFDIIN
jgi:seryl-tRNA synthetase